MAELTPMMKQYMEIKRQNPDSILFFRLGDFYEMFDEDARTASRELELTLTSRDHGKRAKAKEDQMPMCGIPYHASDGYIARLIAKGYKVAICEQMEDPAVAKGLVKRDILRVVTPGTILDQSSLDEKSGNFLCGIWMDPRPHHMTENPDAAPAGNQEEAESGGGFSPGEDAGTGDGVPAEGDDTSGGEAVSTGDRQESADERESASFFGDTEHNSCGPRAELKRRMEPNHSLWPNPGQVTAVVFCDLSTGEIHATSFRGPDQTEHLINELGRFTPAEAVLSDGAIEDLTLVTTLRDKFHCRMEAGGKRFSPAVAEANVLRQFGGRPDRLEEHPEAELALGALLQYLYETQKTDLSHINRLDYYEQSLYMELDLTARRNLELTRTMRGGDRRGSLLWVLDRTKTSMGARCLRGWLERPLLSVITIRRRNGAVERMVEDTIRREELIAALTGLGDMERILGRISCGSAGARDLLALRLCLERLPGIRRHLAAFPDRHLKDLSREIDPMKELTGKIAAAIADEPPVSVREGGFIRDGCNEEVDRLRHILKNGRGVMAEMEAREKEATGIRTLRIRYNKVFGYYIEVSNSYRDQVPDRYIRKQTLVNGERYITQELKELESTILTAGDQLADLEYRIFQELREEVSAAAGQVTRTAAAVAEADALASLAAVAVSNRYCKPEVDESGVIEIREGRHPVVEQTLKDTLFVPNDTYLGERDNRYVILTGPNMAGKSTYMRQVALIALMAQTGSFVPAASAHLGIVDRIFTRVGASDDLSAGQSTFMVEMTEVSNILHAATERSLLVLDEIGRGTSTYDGMSIAQAVLEHCVKKTKAKTLFATHYHELAELGNTLPGAANYTIAVKAKGEDIVFLRKIIPGGADRSYGIEVAKLAGLPASVLRRARVILKALEAGGKDAGTGRDSPASGGAARESVSGAPPHGTVSSSAVTADSGGKASALYRKRYYSATSDTGEYYEGTGVKVLEDGTVIAGVGVGAPEWWRPPDESAYAKDGSLVDSCGAYAVETGKHDTKAADEAEKAPPAEKETSAAGGAPDGGASFPDTAETANDGHDPGGHPPHGEQVSFTALGETEVIHALRRCQPDTMTPREAMELIYEWKKKIQ